MKSTERNVFEEDAMEASNKSTQMFYFLISYLDFVVKK